MSASTGVFPSYLQKSQRMIAVWPLALGMSYRRRYWFSIAFPDLRRRTATRSCPPDGRRGAVCLSYQIMQLHTKQSRRIFVASTQQLKSIIYYICLLCALVKNNPSFFRVFLSRSRIRHHNCAKSPISFLNNRLVTSGDYAIPQQLERRLFSRCGLHITCGISKIQ